MTPFFVVDEKFSELCEHRWQDEGHGYLIRAVKEKGRRTTLLLHREVWRLAFGSVPKELNHKNGLKHDCRIENLEPATRSLNNLERKYRQRDLPTGVYRSGKKFRARIGFRHLGYFDDPGEAAAAYAEAKNKRLDEERMKCQRN